jgi:hypothetical protein
VEDEPTCLSDPDCDDSQICEGGECVDPQGCATEDDCDGDNLQEIDVAEARSVDAQIRSAGQNVVVRADDQISRAVEIPFEWTFFGDTIDAVYVSSNGFITFDPASNDGCCQGEQLPEDSPINQLIAAYWGDLDPSAGGRVTTGVQGRAPSREFVVTWDDVPHFGDDQITVTAQIILHEGTNQATVICADCRPSGGQYTQGVENLEGTYGLTVPGRNAERWRARNDAILFTTDAEQMGVSMECFQAECVEIPSCDTDLDCQFGLPGIVCSNGLCGDPNGCNNDQECGRNLNCVIGACIDAGNHECIRDSQCSNGRLCEGNACQ